MYVMSDSNIFPANISTFHPSLPREVCIIREKLWLTDYHSVGLDGILGKQLQYESKYVYIHMCNHKKSFVN